MIVIVAITLGGIAVARREDMRSRWRLSRGSIGWVVFGAFFLIAAFFLIEEHRAHVLGALPYVLGLAGLIFCLFGHRHTGTGATHDEPGGSR